MLHVIAALLHLHITVTQKNPVRLLIHIQRYHLTMPMHLLVHDTMDAPPTNSTHDSQTQKRREIKESYQYNSMTLHPPTTLICKMNHAVGETICIILLVLLIGIISLSVLLHYLEDSSEIVYSGILFASLFPFLPYIMLVVSSASLVLPFSLLTSA